MHATPPIARRRVARIRGFMLIEVLVSILIFSIGVLALIGLQAKMTHSQTASKMRTDAAYLANELIGVMWSDMKNISSYDACNATACQAWQAKVAQSLPAADITVQADANGVVTITIKWTPSGDDQHTYTTTTYVKANS